MPYSACVRGAMIRLARYVVGGGGMCEVDLIVSEKRKVRSQLGPRAPPTPSLPARRSPFSTGSPPRLQAPLPYRMDPDLAQKRSPRKRYRKSLGVEQLRRLIIHDSISHRRCQFAYKPSDGARSVAMRERARHCASLSICTSPCLCDVSNPFRVSVVGAPDAASRWHKRWSSQCDLDTI